MNEKTLGKRLQLARRRAGLTQQELCQKAGLSYSTLAKIERGAIRSPSVFTVAAIATATDTPMEDLLDLQAARLKSPAPADSKKRSKSGVRFVYFDISGVLIRFFQRAFAAISDESGVPAEVVETLFWRHVDEACRGRMDMEQFNGIFKKELHLNEFDWGKYFTAAVEPMPGIGDLVKWAATHYEVGLLSNTMPGILEQLQQSGLLPTVEYTTIVDSSKAGVIKPDPKIYEVAQQLANAEPAEILLVDDERANLTAADKAGWKVLWFDDFSPDQSIEKIKETLAFN